MKVLVLLSFFALCGCLAASELSTTSTSTTTTTTETSSAVEESTVPKNEDEDETMKTAEDLEEATEEKTKDKRTIEGSLGYGYNDIAGSGRLLRGPSEGKFRAYFSHPQSQQQQHPNAYNQVRYYTSLRTAGAPDYNRQQTEQRPYVFQGPSSPAPPAAAAQNYNFQGNNHVDADSAYFTKAAYQQIPQYRTSPPQTSHSAQNTPLFPGPPAHAPAFYSGHAFSHTPFAAATPNVQHPFLSAGNYHGNPLLYQHPGTTALALLQSPSGSYGHQIIPVIILRVNNDENNSPAFQQHGVSPAFLQGLQSLLYPVQHQPQPQLYSEHPQDHAVPQLLFQDVPPSTKYVQAPVTPGQPSPHKVTYSAQPQKKPLVPTPAPQVTTQKLRKNVVVISDGSVSQSDNAYTQFSKYSYKEKA